MFTRRHYEEIALVLRLAEEIANEDETITGAAMLAGVRHGFAEMLAFDNPRFDRERFLTAARPVEA